MQAVIRSPDHAVDRLGRVTKYRYGGDMRREDIERANARALAARPVSASDAVGNRGGVHDPNMHQARRAYPYLGYVDVEIAGAPPLVMFSNNDDIVAHTYFWLGADAFEPMSIRAWANLSRSAQTIIDIGAFTGVYSLVAAGCNDDATVIAFEPVKRVHERLMVNLLANRLAHRVTAEAVAVGDSNGICAMNIFEGARLSTGSSVVNKNLKKVADREVTRIVTLDAYLRENPQRPVGLVKIDVELAELSVLRGMTDTIERDHPDLIVEVLTEPSFAAVADFLRPFDYTAVILDDGAHTVTYGDDTAYQRGVDNVLFTRKSRDQIGGVIDATMPLLRSD